MSSHLRLGLPKGFFPVGVPIVLYFNVLYPRDHQGRLGVPNFIPSGCMTCPSQRSRLNKFTNYLQRLITGFPTRKQNNIRHVPAREKYYGHNAG